LPEPGAVGAVADLVVLPAEVVEAFRHVASKSLGRKNGCDEVDFLDGEHGGFFTGSKVVLEDKLTTGDAYTLRVLGLRGDIGNLIRNNAAGGVLYGMRCSIAPGSAAFTCDRGTTTVSEGWARSRSCVTVTVICSAASKAGVKAKAKRAAEIFTEKEWRGEQAEPQQGNNGRA